MMAEFIITFGQGDRVRKDCYTVVEAPSWRDAHDLIFATYGKNWAFCYENRERAGVDKFGLTKIPWGA